MRLRLVCLLLATGLLWAQAPAPAPDIPSYEDLEYPPLRQVRGASSKGTRDRPGAWRGWCGG